MVLTRTLETASTGRFLTIYFFLHFLGSEPEPAEPEPAESGVVTEPLEPNRLDQEPTRTEPNRPFPAICTNVDIKTRKWFAGNIESLNARGAVSY